MAEHEREQGQRATGGAAEAAGIAGDHPEEGARPAAASARLAQIAAQEGDRLAALFAGCAVAERAAGSRSSTARIRSTSNLREAHCTSIPTTCPPASRSITMSSHSSNDSAPGRGSTWMYAASVSGS